LAITAGVCHHAVCFPRGTAFAGGIVFPGWDFGTSFGADAFAFQAPNLAAKDLAIQEPPPY
jgi:hypothetical protein